MPGFRAQTRIWRRLVGVLACLCLPVAVELKAADGPLGEYQVKAAYLYNFITLTEWPASLGPELTLCVYGPDPFGADIDALHGKNVGGRTLFVSRVSTVDVLHSCQVVFLAREVMSNLPRILEELQGDTTLTVADSPGAVRDGVAINMRNDADRISFEVNLPAVHGQGLNLSFQLLRLASEVLH